MATPNVSSEEGVAASVPFHDFCVLLERVASMRGTEKKKSVFERFLKKWRESHNELHSTDADTTTDSFYPAMRLLLPQLDRQRPAYGMKETALAKQYIDILSIAKESPDAQKLLNYRAPHAAKQDAGDFATVAYYVLKHRCPDKGSLSIAQVNQYLDDLALSHVKKDRPGVKKAIQMMLRNTSAQEQKWLIRIIMKELKTGLNENSVFAVFHPDAIDLFSVCSSLEKVCTELRSLSTRLNETAINYFSPFRPMLGQRAGIDQVMRLMDHQPFFVEVKYDGERMQLHKQNDQYRYYSRSSRDHTSMFGASHHEGSITPYIHSKFNSKVDSCILDGEMVAWDPMTDTFLPKGDNVDVKTLSPGGGSNIRPCYVVFDVLMINDNNLANCPLRERIEHLKKIFEPEKGFLHFAERKEKSTKEDVIAALNEAIDRREEGLMVKQPGSMYRPDKRKGGGWLKIKPEYIDSLSDQLDLVIIGGYFGSGRRSGMISHFMLGVAVPSQTPGERPVLFYSFCKVGSGYTLGELSELGNKLRPHWKKFDTKKPPDSIILAPGFKEKPDVWIDPRNSKIVQIRAAEIVVSDKYKCGCTLRFPRLNSVRDDKEWFDCMTVDELEQLKLIGSGHLAHQHYEEKEMGAPVTKKRRVKATRVERPRGVAAHFRQTDVSDVQEVSKTFKDKEFCIVNGLPTLPKNEMERKIAEHGGTFVQNPTLSTFIVVVHKTNVKARNIIRKGEHDVVKADWLQECLDAGCCLTLQPHHMLNTSRETAMRFAAHYDKYGDSYTEDLTTETLKEVFSKVEEMEESVACSQSDIAMLESRYFTDDSPHGLFRQCKFYFDRCSNIDNSQTAIPASALEVSELQARQYGGEVSPEFTNTVTHVVFDPHDLTRVSQFREIERGRQHKHHFVLSSWITECIENDQLKSERSFEPRTE